jgi:hypothetical protein
MLVPPAIHLEPYSPVNWNQTCTCGRTECMQRRYGGRYFIVVFGTDNYDYTHWLSRN